MRTTLNIDDDVAAQLAEVARRDGRSLSRAANELLRSGLRSERTPAPIEPYEPPSFDTGRVLLDVTDVADALDALDRDR
ncbi:MAG: CopG family transcriptional regulator [Solirubrobacteraceae bacterium]